MKTLLLICLILNLIMIAANMFFGTWGVALFNSLSAALCLLAYNFLANKDEK